MSSPPAPPTHVAFTFHALGGTLFLAVILWLVAHAILSPVDLFVRQSFTDTYDIVHFAVLGFVFYALSLALLRLRPLGAGWGAAYAASSWLFFTPALFPAQPTGGMMRRVAEVEGYEMLRRSVHQGFVLLSMALLLSFALVQALFLRHALRQPHHPGVIAPTQP